MNNSEILRVLKRAKNLYEGSYIGMHGMCYCLKEAFFKTYYKSITGEEELALIPEFNSKFLTGIERSYGEFW